MIAPNLRPAPARDRDGITVHTLRRLFKRNRLAVLGAPIVVLLAAAVFTFLAAPVYDATTTLRFDNQRSNLAVLDALQELSSGSEIQTELAELRTSVSLAGDVVDALDLHVEVREPREVPRARLFATLTAARSALPAKYELRRTANGGFELSGAGRTRTVQIGERVELAGLSFILDRAALEHERIQLRVPAFPVATRELMRRAHVARPDREANILQIRFEGTDRLLVQAIPNEMARQFVVRRDSVRKTQARSTVVFLREQIDTLGAQLNRAETALLAFRDSGRVVSPEAEGEAQLQRLAEFQADRDIVDSERRSLASIMAEIDAGAPGLGSSSYRRLLGFPTLLINPSVSELFRAVNEMENERAALLKGRTEADPEVLVITQRIRQIDSELKELTKTYLEGLGKRVESFDAVLAGFSQQLRRIPAQEINLARHRRLAEVNEELYTELQTRLKEAQIAAAVADATVRVIDPASLPFKPIRPNRPLVLVLALLLGLALGAAIAFAREHLDNTIRSREDLQDLSGSFPVLGMVPRIESLIAERRSVIRVFSFKRNGGVHDAAARRGTSGPVAEAYRTLRTNIAFMHPDAPAKAIVVTSAMPAEGKSTSSRNLALTLANQGRRVILIDADLRRGLLHQALQVPAEPGLSNLLLGRASVQDVLRQVQVDGVEFCFMAAGTTPPNPAELLGSARLPLLLDELRPQFDTIVIDSPPLNLVTDAAIIGSKADAVLLVARSGVTERDAFRHALEQLDSVHARVLGCILNDVDSTGEGYYGRRGAAAYYTATPAASS